MSNTQYRRETLLKNDATSKPVWAESYTVTAFAIGARASAASAGATIAVYPGHAFRVNDYVMVGMDITTYRLIQAVTETQLTVPSNVTVAKGDVLTNLGTDGGGTAPDYLGSPITIQDATGATITSSELTSDSDGEYEYFYNAPDLWEMIRDASGDPVKVITGLHDNTGGDRTTFTDQDATPSVYMGTNFQTANTIATTITMFDEGYTNQVITVYFGDSLTTVDFSGTNLEGNSGADWYPATGSIMTAFFTGTKWVCTATDVEGVLL